MSLYLGGQIGLVKNLKTFLGKIQAKKSTDLYHLTPQVQVLLGKTENDP